MKDPQVLTAPQGTSERRAGDEPIAGYVLVEPLGRGGFGEVWKCVAPGGLHKAVKFVPAGGDQHRQEEAAFERVRSIRHAFLLTLERVEAVGGDLVMVMELADAQLQDRFDECRRDRQRGIPRDELLGYLSDAAEALDVIAAKYGLQHLDVKPANLFLIDGHVKVGDYGLVRCLGADKTATGLTPKYSAPEVLRGHADARSDQYSLALVYHELLTGSFPYSGRTPQQLMLQHVTADPDLAALPEADRPVVGMALAKQPARRFPSCTAFVKALAGAQNVGPLPGHTPPPRVDAPPDTKASANGTVVLAQAAGEPDRGEQPVRGHGLPVVAWVPRMRPQPARAGEVTAVEFIDAVVEASRAEAGDGAWSCRFMCTTSDERLPQKLAGVARQFGLTVETPAPDAVLLRRTLTGMSGSGAHRASGGELWVSVRRPGAGPEIVATAGLEGATAAAQRALPGVLAAVRGALENARERRIHQRYPTGLPIRIHIVGTDGSVGGSEDGVCEDVSAGGVKMLTPPVSVGKRVYLEFRTVEGVAGNALLADVVRSSVGPGGLSVACRFRTSDGPA